MDATYTDTLVGRQNLEIDRTVRQERDRVVSQYSADVVSVPITRPERSYRVSPESFHSTNPVTARRPGGIRPPSVHYDLSAK